MISQIILQAEALDNFLRLFSGQLLRDIGPRLTCLEAEALAELMETHGRKAEAHALRVAHAESDEEGDMPKHLALKTRGY